MHAGILDGSDAECAATQGNDTMVMARDPGRSLRYALKGGTVTVECPRSAYPASRSRPRRGPRRLLPLRTPWPPRAARHRQLHAAVDGRV